MAQAIRSLSPRNRFAKRHYEAIATAIQEARRRVNGSNDPISVVVDELADCFAWLSLNAKYAKTWPKITVKKAPPPDSKEWEGKPDKLQYFSANPGTGD